MNKLFGCLLGFLSATAAYSDQCAYLTQEQAIDAARLLRVGDTVLAYCEPCGDAGPQKLALSSIAVSKIAGSDSWGLYLNGENKDLAYTYVSTGTRLFSNMSKLVGCPSAQVSLSIAE